MLERYLNSYSKKHNGKFSFQSFPLSLVKMTFLVLEELHCHQVFFFLV